MHAIESLVQILPPHALGFRTGIVVAVRQTRSGAVRYDVLLECGHSDDGGGFVSGLTEDEVRGADSVTGEATQLAWFYDCMFLFCLRTGPHPHPVCSRCRSLRWGNSTCPECAEKYAAYREWAIALTVDQLMEHRHA
jgi:hypothetical protein